MAGVLGMLGMLGVWRIEAERLVVGSGDTPSLRSISKSSVRCLHNNDAERIGCIAVRFTISTLSLCQIKT